MTDAIGRVTTLERNADNLVTKVTRPSDGELPDGTTPGTVVTELDYDERGNLTLGRDAAGTTLERVNRFQYEPVFNNVTKTIDPTNALADPPCGTAGVTCFEYDPKGNLETVIRFVNGASFDAQILTYNALGLVETRIDANGNPPAQFAYNILGSIEQFTDPALNVTTFAL